MAKTNLKPADEKTRALAEAIAPVLEFCDGWSLSPAALFTELARISSTDETCEHDVKQALGLAHDADGERIERYMRTLRAAPTGKGA